MGVSDTTLTAARCATARKCGISTYKSWLFLDHLDFDPHPDPRQQPCPFSSFPTIDSLVTHPKSHFRSFILNQHSLHQMAPQWLRRIFYHRRLHPSPPLSSASSPISDLTSNMGRPSFWTMLGMNPTQREKLEVLLNRIESLPAMGKLNNNPVISLKNLRQFVEQSRCDP